MVRAKRKNCTTKHNMHSEAHENLGTLLSCTGSSWTSSTESTKYLLTDGRNSIGSNWARTLSQISLTLFLRKKDNGIQNIGSFENIWTIHGVGAKIWHARNEEGTQKNMGCGTTGSTIREAHPTGETPATTTANFCVSRRPPKQAKHRETCCRTHTQPWLFQLNLLAASVANFAGVATAMGGCHQTKNGHGIRRDLLVQFTFSNFSGMRDEIST